MSMKKKTKMGRPPKAPADKYGEHVNVHMTQAERAMLEAEAKKRGLSLSSLLMSPWRIHGGAAQGTAPGCARIDANEETPLRRERKG